MDKKSLKELFDSLIVETRDDWDERSLVETKDGTSVWVDPEPEDRCWSRTGYDACLAAFILGFRAAKEGSRE